MSINAIFANLACTDFDRSTDWYADLFDRAPDARPMEGLAEWHHGASAGFQLHRDPTRAGLGAVTLIVSAIATERERIVSLAPGEIEHADNFLILRMRDPDGNLVVMAGD
ncbi:VOC family protein [Pseudooceanicola sp. LIPI14-2-Ac024]|uniref:VOC family protein n=1 Tax=Pseudooceanicola sp. LIPI14-2-Ac024 TaxID=3344875 RepID=UPI0035CFA9B7